MTDNRICDKHNKFIEKHSKFKALARATAVLVTSTMILTGCGGSTTGQVEEDDDDDLFIFYGGTYYPYSSYKASNKITGNEKFYTKSGNGYSSYSPSASEMADIKSGKFSGRTAISKSSTSTSKSFGGSSSRSGSTGG